MSWRRRTGMGLLLSVLTIAGAATFLSGITFVCLGIAGLAGYRFAPGTLSPDVPAGWRVAIGAVALGGSTLLRQAVKSARDQQNARQ